MLLYLLLCIGGSFTLLLDGGADGGIELSDESALFGHRICQAQFLRRHLNLLLGADEILLDTEGSTLLESLGADCIAVVVKDRVVAEVALAFALGPGQLIYDEALPA